MQVQYLLRSAVPRGEPSARQVEVIEVGRDPGRRNVTIPLLRPRRRTVLPRLETSRLRATWLRDCARFLGLATFRHAAGITCSQRLGDLLAALDPGSEEQAVRLLGAQAAAGGGQFFPHTQTQAHEKARKRYEGLTKAELSDLLARRELPRSGNVDELIERLVEADSK